MLQILDRIKTWQFFLAAVLCSELFTLILNSLQSLFRWGMISRELIEIGAVDAVFVSLLVTALLLPLLRYSSKVALEKQILHKEIESRREIEKALRESEESYRVLFNQDPLPGWLYDTETYSFLLVNEKAVKHYGYTPQEFLSMTIKDIRPPDDIARLLQFTSNMIDLPVVSGSWRHRKKDGTLIDVEVNSHPIRFEGKKARRVIVHDITARKQAEDMIKQSLKEKETLLKEIHHRVKNNMAVVSSLLSLQARGTENPTVKSLLEESQLRIKSMALVHEKLYQANNVSSVNFEDYIRSITAEIISLYRLDTGTVRTEINIEAIELDLECAVPCGLIINELLTNAFKYAFPDNRSGVLNVSFTKTDDTCILAIKDNGIGLPAGFDYKNSHTLGLQLVDILTGQLRGTLQIKSDKGTEAVVKFNIRRNRPEAGPERTDT